MQRGEWQSRRVLATETGLRPRAPPVRRDTLAVIWIGGLLLAGLIYLVGPDQFLDLSDPAGSLDFGFRRLILSLGTQLFGVIRALAIALYRAFVVLALLSSARGRRAWGR